MLTLACRRFHPAVNNQVVGALDGIGSYPGGHTNGTPSRSYQSGNHTPVENGSTSAVRSAPRSSRCFRQLLSTYDSAFRACRGLAIVVA